MKTAHPVDIHVGKRLQQIRKLRGLSQQDLGQKITTPVTFQQLQKYERGQNRLSASKLWEFGEVLEVPPAYFFEGLDNPEYEDPSLPAPIIRTAKELSCLPKAVRDNIVFIIKKLARKYKSYS